MNSREEKKYLHYAECEREEEVLVFKHQVWIYGSWSIRWCLIHSHPSSSRSHQNQIPRYLTFHSMLIGCVAVFKLFIYITFFTILFILFLLIFSKNLLSIQQTPDILNLKLTRKIDQLIKSSKCYHEV